MGVVFEETDHYGDGCDPIVRWFNMSVCNIYQGDVVKISGRKPQGIEIIDKETGEIYGLL